MSDVVAYLPIAAPVAPPERAAGVPLGEVPAARVAVLVHTGAYDSLDIAHRTLGAWVARFAQPSGECIREIYPSDPSNTADQAGYSTEICWPIAMKEYTS